MSRGIIAFENTIRRFHSLRRLEISFGDNEVPRPLVPLRTLRTFTLEGLRNLDVTMFAPEDSRRTAMQCNGGRAKIIQQELARYFGRSSVRDTVAVPLKDLTWSSGD